MKLNDRFTLLGRSVSGVETCLVVPELKLAFDVGYCPPEAVRCQTVLVTHGHPDHLAGAVQHAATRSLLNQPPSRFVVPPSLLNDLVSLFTLWNSFQPHQFGVEVVALDPGDRLSLGKGRFVVPFKTVHSMPSQGYVVYEQRMKLKPEYVGTPGPELGRLRKEGVEVMDMTEVPVLAYTGDTRPEVFDTTPVLGQVEVLVTESTFLGMDDVEMAARKGHTHLKELAERAHLLADVQKLVLTHFSQKYDAYMVQDFVRGTLPASLLARTLWTEMPEER